MTRRKWLVRSLVTAILLAVAGLFGAYLYLTRPEAVRRQVIDRAEAVFVGAHVKINTARWCLFGGITASDVRFTRRDDPNEEDFGHIPRARIYPDKEQLLRGQISIRKIELDQPRLRVERDRHGNWNLDGILGPIHPEIPIPTIVMHNATIIVEDRLDALTPRQWELNDIELTLVNDPLPVLHFELAGRSDLAPTLKLQGSWHRVAKVFQGQVELPRLPVQPALVEQLATYCPTVAEHAQQLTGHLDVKAAFDYDPERTPAWNQEARLQLHDGRLTHPLLPWPVEQVEAEVTYRPGQLSLDRLTAASDETRLLLTGAVQLPPGTCVQEADLDLALQIQQLPLLPALFAKLPDRFQTIRADYAPEGAVDLDAEFSRRSGQWRQHALVKPLGLRARCAKFPYPLQDLRGTLEHTQDGDRPRLVMDLTGKAAETPVYIKGHVHSQADVHVVIHATNAAIDEPLIKSLPPSSEALARAFHVGGRIDFLADIRRPEGKSEFGNRFVVRFHDAAIRYDVFPYPLEGVSGVLDVRPDGWEFRDFEGRNKGGLVQAACRSVPGPGGARVAIDLTGRNLALDSDLEEALPPKLKVAWRSFAPAGRLSLAAAIDNAPGQPQDIKVTISVQGCTLRPTFFPYTLEDVRGTIHFANQKIDIGPTTARHGDSVLGLGKGEVFLKPQGGFYAKLDDLTGNPLVLDNDLLQAVPGSVQRFSHFLDLKDPLALSTQVIVDMPGEPGQPPTIFWDGGLSFRDSSIRLGFPLEHVTGQVFCRGRHNGQKLQGVVGNLLLERLDLARQPFQQVHTHFEIPRDAPDVIQLPNFKAKLFDGDIGGEVRLEMGPSLRYDVNLSLLNLSLEKFGQHNLDGRADLQGQAFARLYLTGRGTDLNALEGRGSIDVPDGKLYNLPLLLDLLKVIGLRWPDRTAFEEAHTTFHIHGPRVHVEKLDLFGHVVSLSGQGELNLDGSDLNLDFYAVWGRITEVMGAFGPLMKEIPPALGQFLLKVKMRGDIKDPKFQKEPLPMLVEPVEKLLKRFVNPPRLEDKLKVKS